VRRGCPMSKCMLLEVVGDFEHLSLYISLSGLNLNWSLLMRKFSRKVAAHFSAAWSRSHKWRSDISWLDRSEGTGGASHHRRHRKWLDMCPVLLSVQKFWAIVMSTPHKNTLSPAPVCYFQLPCSHIFDHDMLRSNGGTLMAETVVACLTNQS